MLDPSTMALHKLLSSSNTQDVCKQRTVLFVTPLRRVSFISPAIYFFFASKTLASTVTTFPNITTPFPSMKATRDRPSQFLKESATSGCWGSKVHWAISLDFREWGSSIFLPPVSFPIFHLIADTRQAARPQRTKP